MNKNPVRIAPIALLVLAGQVLAAEPQYLIGIAVDQAQTVYLADRELPGIWQLTEGKLSLMFSGSRKFRTPLNAVRCLAVDRDGQLLAGDTSTRDVYRLVGDQTPAPLTKGEIGMPLGVAVTKAGALLVVDLEVHRVWKVPVAGGQPTLYAEVTAPRAITVDRDDRVWVVSHGKDQLLRSNAEGKLEAVVSGRAFKFPSAVVVDDEGGAFVCDTYAKTIWKVPAGKSPERFFAGEPLVSPVAMSRLGSDLLVVDPGAKAVIRIDMAAKASRLEWTVQAP